MPSTVSRPVVGLEIWLHGSREEIRAGAAAFGDDGFVVVQCSALEPLPGGRYRMYARVHLRGVPGGDTPDISSRDGSVQCEIPFPSPSSAT